MGHARGNDDVLERELFADQDVEHRSRHGSRIDEAHGGVGLRIEVDQQRLETFVGDRGGQVDGGGGLSDATFLISDRNDHSDVDRFYA